MLNARELGERISAMFNFIYELKDDYYVMGRDYFRRCTDIEIGVYKGFKDALTETDQVWLINQYKRIRKYTSNCRPNSRTRDEEIVDFVQKLV